MGGFVSNNSSNNNTKAFVLTVAEALAEHKAEDVMILDLRGIASWTDYFVLATANSSTHLRGLLKTVEETAAAENQQSINKPDVGEDESWVLVDLGDVIVHLMSGTARSFYELEKLWFKAPQLKVEPSDGKGKE
jgi:ribosome-associated protein